MDNLRGLLGIIRTDDSAKYIDKSYMVWKWEWIKELIKVFSNILGNDRAVERVYVRKWMGIHLTTAETMDYFSG